MVDDSSLCQFDKLTQSMNIYSYVIVMLFYFSPLCPTFYSPISVIFLAWQAIQPFAKANRFKSLA